MNIITRAPPDAFAGQRAFAILPVEFGGLQVGEVSEAQYLSGKDPSQQASFAADKAALAGELVGSLRSTLLAAGVDLIPATGPAAARFTIRPSVGFIEPGAYMFVTERPSRVDLRVRILSASGAVVEEVTLTHGTDVITWAEIASGTRLRKDGAALGEMMGAYLLTRVGASPGQPSAVVAPPPSSPPPLAPPPVAAPIAQRPPTRPVTARPPTKASGGCTMDTECKGDRLCQNGACVAPSASH